MSEKPVTYIKKDKTSEAVIVKMAETRNKEETESLKPVTLYRGGGVRRSGEKVKQ